jgi:hypothetical protein
MITEKSLAQRGRTGKWGRYNANINILAARGLMTMDR